MMYLLKRETFSSHVLNIFKNFQEPAVHEQKLNFLRAHLTELNRRMVSLMETSEKGFPTHSNLQVVLFKHSNTYKIERQLAAACG